MILCNVIKNFQLILSTYFLFTVFGSHINSKPKLIKAVKKIELDDQKFRSSEKLCILNKGEVEILDRINLIRVEAIIKKYGWLSQSDLQNEFCNPLFLVIQHSPYEIQKKYLPLLKKAVIDGKEKSSRLAMLEDRIAINECGMQIYGSQIRQDDKTGQYYIYPIKEPSTVDARRKSVGLEPLSDYVSYWGIKYDVIEDTS